MRSLLSTYLVFLVLCVSGTAQAEEKILVIFGVDAVNVDSKLAGAASVAIATELESRGLRIVDAESAVMKLGSSPDQLNLSSAQIKESVTNQLGATHYVDGSLVKMGRLFQIRAAMHLPSGEVIASKKIQVRSEDELTAAVVRIVDILSAHQNVSLLELEDKQLPPKKAVPTKPRIEKNFGILFGQAFGYGDISSFSQFAFDIRFELDNLFIEISPGIGFGTEGIEEPQFIFDMAVAYYLSHRQVSPYLGAGLGVFAGNRLSRSDDQGSDFMVGWNLFPTVGIELLRKTFMRIHIDFRYIFNYSADRFGHAPMALAGVNF